MRPSLCDTDTGRYSSYIGRWKGRSDRSVSCLAVASLGPLEWQIGGTLQRLCSHSRRAAQCSGRRCCLCTVACTLPARSRRSCPCTLVSPSDLVPFSEGPHRRSGPCIV